MAYGNNFYKSNNYGKAAFAYDNALKINADNTTALTFGGYSYMHLKNAAKAVKYLDRAFALTKNPLIKSQVDKIRYYYSIQSGLPDPALGGPQHDTTGIYLLIGLDVVLAGAAVFTFIDSNGAADEYDKKYDLINATSDFNYKELLDMKAAVKLKQTAFGWFGALAGAAIAYTFADAFLLHWAFPVTTVFSTHDKSVMIVYKGEF